MQRGLKQNNRFAGRSATHMLRRVGEDRQRSGLARSSRPMLDNFLFAVVYLHVSRIYASNKTGVLLESSQHW